MQPVKKKKEKPPTNASIKVNKSYVDSFAYVMLSYVEILGFPTHITELLGSVSRTPQLCGFFILIEEREIEYGWRVKIHIA